LLPKNIQTEASGNINEKNIVSYAKTGVGRISMGSLTHTISNFDFSLEIKK
jgi:nicotinate-nucleotide pyrophosphorylase (carboxylating)